MQSNPIFIIDIDVSHVVWYTTISRKTKLNRKSMYLQYVILLITERFSLSLCLYYPHENPMCAENLLLQQFYCKFIQWTRFTRHKRTVSICNAMQNNIFIDDSRNTNYFNKQSRLYLSRLNWNHEAQSSSYNVVLENRFVGWY